MSCLTGGAIDPLMSRHGNWPVSCDSRVDWHAEHVLIIKCVPLILRSFIANETTGVPLHPRH